MASHSDVLARRNRAKRIAYFRLVLAAGISVVLCYAPFVWIASGVLGSIPLTVFIFFSAVANFIYAVSRIPTSLRGRQ